MLTGEVSRGLDDIFSLINQAEKGAVIFINQQQSSENLLSRIEKFKGMQQKGEVDKSTTDCNGQSRFWYWSSNFTLDLKIKNLNLISNSSKMPE